MADRTLIICACLVLIAVLFFAGAGLVLMQKERRGETPAGGFSRTNEEQRMSAPHGDYSEEKMQIRSQQGKCPLNHDRPGEFPDQGRCHRPLPG